MMFTGTISPARGFFRRLAIAAGLSALAAGAAAEGVFMVQIAAVKSESRAQEEWSRLQSRHAELLGDLDLRLQEVNLGERGVFFRMQTGPFPNRTTALDMCRQLKAAEIECIVAER